MTPEALLELAGLPASDRPRRLSGGDMGEVWRVGDRVVKTHPRPPAGLFEAEARGLRALAAAGVRVPRVDWVGPQGIVMAWLGSGPADWPALGRMIAEMHRDVGATYGAPEPLFIGRLGLPAGEGSWPEVYRSLRLGPLIRATRSTLGSLEGRVEGWLDRLVLPLEGASLVHGDLWSGNVHFGADGPALIDPSTQRAERGLDLAMMALFGGFPPPFWRAYEEVWPISPEVRAALPAYRLYFLLVHVHFFGRSYLSGVASALDELGG